MDLHPIQGGEVIILVTNIELCWVPCDGQASIHRGRVISLVALYWVSCDGQAFHSQGKSNKPSHFILGIL